MGAQRGVSGRASGLGEPVTGVGEAASLVEQPEQTQSAVDLADEAADVVRTDRGSGFRIVPAFTGHGFGDGGALFAVTTGEAGQMQHEDDLGGDGVSPVGGDQRGRDRRPQRMASPRPGTAGGH